MTKSMTTSLTKINMRAMAFACLALTSARAVATDQTGDPSSPPGTAPYVLGSVNPIGTVATEGTISISGDGFGNGDGGYGLSGWEPTHRKTCQEVPDGGSTASLLGLGLLGLGFMGRCLSERKRSEAGNAA